MKAVYEIVEDAPEKPLVIRDIGWRDHMSVTNDAEAVVEDLWNKGKLSNHRQLFYYDSSGDLDELVHTHGIFVRFQLGPNRKMRTI